ncbi:MAG: hypothetical protein QNJ07_14930 [Woeseiaceae bacterium]|nr:hypothetical protein [Woeseiaceae bacterium]
MEVSTVSGSSISSQLASAKASRAVSRSHDSEAVADTRERRESDEVGRRRGRALGIFGKELRLALMAQVRARFAQWHTGYGAQQPAASADDVADEAVAAAKQVALEKPTQVAKSMVSFRSTVRESAEYARNTVGEADELVEVDDAVRKVEAGLDELEQAASANRESSASVLAVDMRSRQRSTIRIRTQEGDIVRFALKRVDRLSASDQAVTDKDGFMALTEVELSSRTRLMLRVKGDINASELGAIKNVFAQAEAMASEFFNGDIGAAFAMAEGFEFDVEQLARVNLRFRSQQVSDIAYRETVVAPVAGPSESAPEPAAVAPQPGAERSPSSTPPEPAKLPEVTPAVEDAAPVEQPVAADDIGESALEGYFDALSGFLRSLGEGFESSSVRYHYSESFKLRMLESVMHTMAPDESADAED